jgi:hypothetical protein
MANDGDLVTVYETDLRERIALVEYALKDAGIRYIATNEMVSVVYPVDGMAVVGFQVSADDADRARAVIAALPFRRATPPGPSGEPAEVEPQADEPETPEAVAWLRLRLSVGRAEAVQRLEDALARSIHMVEGRATADGFVLRSSDSPVFGCACRGSITDRPGGSELICDLGSAMLQNVGVLAVVAATAFYMVHALAVAVSDTVAGGAEGLVLLLTTGVWTVGLVAAVWGALRRRRQGERLRDFLFEALGDVAPGGRAWAAGAV